MAILAAAAVVPLGLLFFLSGLIVNAVQATCFVLIRPLSKNVYRRVNRQVAELLWLELVFLVDWWARVQIKVFTDPETFRLLGKEHVLLVSNHRSDIDWLVGWVLAQRAGCLGSALAVMKKLSKFLPGFVSAVTNMRSFVPAIYDITVAIPKSSSQPTILRLFKGQSFVVHVHIKRHKMKDLPETDDAVAQWCKDAFIAKDALLDKHKAEDTFGDQYLQNTGRPLKSLLVVFSWALTLILGTLKFVQSSSFLSSWKGIAVSITGLGLVTVLVHILIKFSQSERSTPAKVAPTKPKDTQVKQYVVH